MTAQACPDPSTICEGLVKLTALCLRNDSSDIARAFDAEEAASLLRCVEIVEQWLEKLVVTLDSAQELRNHASDEFPRGHPRPRNKVALQRGQAVRAEIRAALERHPPAATPLTAKQIRPLLSRTISERTIQWHVRQINIAVAAIQSAAKLNHSDAHGDSERVSSAVDSETCVQLGRE
jgi:hypothetical protein